MKVTRILILPVVGFDSLLSKKAHLYLVHDPVPSKS